MPRRIDIELTSALSDGSWTWRKAGAQKPKGTVDGSILPDDASVGDELKVEAEQMLDGMEILSVVKGREKAVRTDLLELIPDDKPFEAVIETRAKRGGGERRGRDDDRGGRGGRGRDGDSRGRGRDSDSRGRDGDSRGRDGDKRGRDGDSRGRDGDSRGRDGDKRGRNGDSRGRDGDSRGRDGDSRGRDGDSRGRDGAKRGRGRDGGSADGERGDRTDRPRKPHFEAPPEVPQRPKPKRLRPGKARTQELLASVPEEQRPIAELALQGMAAVRTRVKEENIKLKADGKPEMPEATVTKMAEDMLPKLRVAEWLDRAEAAQRQMQHLDLRDLRSVVAASADSMVARDESTRTIAEELKVSLVTKQTEEMAHWLEDVDAALTVGRVIRALRLSSQPPKAGVMFPPELARRLGEAATKSLLPEDSGDRWSAVLEAGAFSPVRALITPTVPPTTIGDDLKKTARRLGPLLPQVAALLGVDVPADAKRPKPLRPTSRKEQKKARDDKRETGSGRGERGGRDEGAGRDDRSGRGRDDRGGRGRDDRGGRHNQPKDRPKGMRDVAEVMAAKRAAEAAEVEAQAAAEAAAAEAAEAAEANVAADVAAPEAPEATEAQAADTPNENADAPAHDDATSDPTSDAPAGDAGQADQSAPGAPADDADGGAESSGDDARRGAVESEATEPESSTGSDDATSTGEAADDDGTA